MVQSLKARCSSCLGPLSALGLAPARERAWELAVDLAWTMAWGLAPVAGLELARSSALAGALAVVLGAALGVDWAVALVAVLEKGLVLVAVLEKGLVLVAAAYSARVPCSRAARPAGSPWAAMSQWRGSRRRPTSRLTTAMGL